MYAFTLERPATVADAAKLAAAGGKPLAGGQTLLASMKLRLAAPEQLVDLGGIKELAGIKKEGNAFVIGAMTRHLDVGANAEIKAAFPALAWLADHIGDRQVRAMGTIGGSVANNDPGGLLPQRGAGLGRDRDHQQARDRGRRLLPGPVRHRAGRGRADHRDPLPDPEARGLREAAAEGLQLPAGRHLRDAGRRRRARGGHRRGQRRVPPHRGWRTRWPRASRPRPRPA